MTVTKSNPIVTPFFDPASCTFSYLVKDPSSPACAVIDAVLDFDYASGEISYQSATELIEAINSQQLDLQLLIETHVHADHLSAAPYIQEQIGGKIAISKHIVDIQEEFGKIFNEGTRFQRDGSQFDILFEDNQPYQIGSLEGLALYTPGHTPACMTHCIGDAAFVGDTLFNPDEGTARTDFPGGNARDLYRSIQKIMALPEETRLFICHDYQAGGRELNAQTSLQAQRQNNVHINAEVTEDQFVELRENRDKSLNMPKLFIPSLQVNMRAGNFPEAADNDTVYLKVPVSGLKHNHPVS